MMHLSVHGRIFHEHKWAKIFAQLQADRTQREVPIMQKDDSMLPAFVLMYFHPKAGVDNEDRS